MAARSIPHGEARKAANPGEEVVEGRRRLLAPALGEERRADRLAERGADLAEEGVEHVGPRLAKPQVRAELRVVVVVDHGRVRQGRERRTRVDHLHLHDGVGEAEEVHVRQVAHADHGHAPHLREPGAGGGQRHGGYLHVDLRGAPAEVAAVVLQLQGHGAVRGRQGQGRGADEVVGVVRVVVEDPELHQALRGEARPEGVAVKDHGVEEEPQAPPQPDRPKLLAHAALPLRQRRVALGRVQLGPPPVEDAQPGRALRRPRRERLEGALPARERPAVAHQRHRGADPHLGHGHLPGVDAEGGELPYHVEEDVLAVLRRRQHGLALGLRLLRQVGEVDPVPEELGGLQALEGEAAALLPEPHARAPARLALLLRAEPLPRVVEALQPEALLGGVRHPVHDLVPARRAAGLALPTGDGRLAPDLDVEHPAGGEALPEVLQEQQLPWLRLQPLTNHAPRPQDAAVVHGEPVEEPVLWAEQGHLLVERQLVHGVRQIFGDPVVFALAVLFRRRARRAGVPHAEEGGCPPAPRGALGGREEALRHRRRAALVQDRPLGGLRV
mmetsp:Transcript_5895/g.16760  ORF Transcript_5895/g.16760 Transcript_5895/m.16760 type:complete len:557 (+) Transcript_5895:278-1948(+)